MTHGRKDELQEQYKLFHGILSKCLTIVLITTDKPFHSPCLFNLFNLFYLLALINITEYISASC